MTDTENLVLEHLRRLREDLGAFRAEMREDVSDLKLRMSALEQSLGHGLSGVQMAIGQIQVSMGSHHRRTDRLETRMESAEARIDRDSSLERRLEEIEKRLSSIGS